MGATGRRPSRRGLLLGGGTAAVLATGAAGLAVEQGALPGRPWLQAHLGLDGTAGTVPDVAGGEVVSGSFPSRHRLGQRTGWSLVRPPDVSGTLPLVVALHGLGGDHRTALGPRFAVDRYLAAGVASGVPAFAVATVDAGSSYYHPRPSGEDTAAMVVEELLPRLARHGVHARDSDRIGLLGWSMGGYGALRLGGLLGPDRVAAVVAVSPALWRDPDDASRSGFDDVAEYERFSVLGRQADLDGIPVRVDCGTGDPFYRAVQAYVAGFDDASGVVSSFQPGAHEAGFWRRMLPAELRFLGAHVAPGPTSPAE